MAIGGGGWIKEARLGAPYLNDDNDRALWVPCKGWCKIVQLPEQMLDDRVYELIPQMFIRLNLLSETKLEPIQT